MAAISGFAGPSVMEGAQQRVPGPTELRQRPTMPAPAGWVRLALLSVAMLLVHGYHPFAEDGGLYAAGIERLLDPALFPHSIAFVTAHLHYSLFAPLLARSVRLSHLPLDWVLFLTYLVGLYSTLYAALLLLRRCVQTESAAWAGIALLAAWATLPVAGTSLVLIDPYLTARSFSTPLSLLAIAFAMDEWQSARHSAWLCALCLLAAAAFHPLMAAYAFAVVLTLRMARMARLPIVAGMLALVAFLSATVLYLLSPSESEAIVLASVSRYYWFLSQWQWYELCGLVGPCLIFAALLRWTPQHFTPGTRRLLQALLICAAIAVLLALSFCHRDAASHLLARLQPLRVFLLLYAVLPLLLGAALFPVGKDPGTSHAPRQLLGLVGLLVVSAAALFAAQRDIFPASPHLEAPFATETNPWSQAFRWTRDHTPKDAVFALDADYISAPAEDAQSFRAIAQRSSLPDFSKDGGEASITPSLALLWQQGVALQQNLSLLNDRARDARLLPTGVTWEVLRVSAVTAHLCPYRNAIVKVCKLRP